MFFSPISKNVHCSGSFENIKSYQPDFKVSSKADGLTSKSTCSWSKQLTSAPKVNMFLCGYVIHKAEQVNRGA